MTPEEHAEKLYELLDAACEGDFRVPLDEYYRITEAQFQKAMDESRPDPAPTTASFSKR